MPSRLAALGSDLRSAEESLDGRRIRELSQQRRELIRELTRQALAEAGQRSAPASLQEEVSATLNAALADPQVAGDLAAGRLLRSAEHAGFGFGAASGFGEASGGLASVPDSAAPPRRERAEKPARAGRERAKAEKATAEQARAAERERAEAERARAEQQRRREAVEAARRAVAEADQAVEAAESAERDAAEAVEDVQRELGEAYKRHADARRQARQAAIAQRNARRALDRLGE